MSARPGYSKSVLPRKHRRRLRALDEIEQRLERKALIKRGDQERLARVRQEKTELIDEEEAITMLVLP